MKYSIITFGCRVNQADSLGFEEELLSRGARPTTVDAADLVIVNTCSVTATADQGARQTIRRVARDNPSAQIVVTGCYATRSPEEVAALPNVTRVVSNEAKPRLIPIISASSAGSACHVTTADRFGDGEGSCGAAIEPGVAGRTAFTLRVQTGCAESCSYCIIPTTRGRPRSVPIDAVLREGERVAAAGFKEIALTGVHLGSYGRDLTPRTSLVDLLRALNGARLKAGTTGAFRHAGLKAGTIGTAGSVRLQPDRDVLFRISSLEPMDCTAEVVDLVASSDAFAPHFHLPLQHASDRMLRAMCRPYTVEYYASLVNEIRARMPGASIGADVIVGFPGETDRDFEELLAYLESSPLTHVHVFPYSDRPGTRASGMRDQVSGVAVRERGRRVRAAAERLSAAFHASQIGTTHRALTIEDGSTVVTGNYLKLRVGQGRVRNEWVDVRVVSDRQGELLTG